MPFWSVRFRTLSKVFYRRSQYIIQFKTAIRDTLEDLFRADRPTGHFNIHRLCNSRPIGLSSPCHLARTYDIPGVASLSRRTEYAAVFKIVAAVARLPEEKFVYSLETGTHNHKRRCNNSNIEFDHNHEVGRNYEPWEVVSERNAIRASYESWQ